MFFQVIIGLVLKNKIKNRFVSYEIFNVIFEYYVRECYCCKCNFVEDLLFFFGFNLVMF